MHDSDRRLICASAFLRAVATGLVAVLAGVWFARLSFTPDAIGNILGAGLLGSALASLLVTLRGDGSRRRRLLVLLSLLSCAGVTAVALVSDAALAGAAAFLGMLNGMGRDRGASLVIEQALLPATTTDRGRTQAFAWYALLQDIGHAVGSLLAGLPELLRRADVLTSPGALAGGGSDGPFRVTFLFAALLLLVPGLLALRLSPAIEPAPAAARAAVRARLSPRSRPIVARLAALFALDSLGGGFLLTSLLAYFFHERFGVNEAVLGPLFFGARVLNALSHLLAAWLARRIGLVNTMVFTHIPSSLLLVTVPFAPSFPVAAALYLLREGLVEMDVPTRTSYMMAVVAPHERTFVSGITNLVRTGGWAAGPFVAGLFMDKLSLATALWIGAGLKLSYDVLLWRAFRRVRPPEEVASR